MQVTVKNTHFTDFHIFLEGTCVIFESKLITGI